MFRNRIIHLSFLQFLLTMPIITQATEGSQVDFVWHCQPQAERLIHQQLDFMLELNHAIKRLRLDLLEKTSTRLQDWMDHIVCVYTDALVTNLQEAGFTLQETSLDYDTYRHLGAQLPAVVLNKKDSKTGVAISVDSISDFHLAYNHTTQIEGTPFCSYRKSCVNIEKEVCLWIIERKGSLTMEPDYESPFALQQYLQCGEKWKNRPRGIENEELAFETSLCIAQELADKLGANRAACLVLEIERQYWQNRNTAAQLQKNRQDCLGMGWGNHDHHTFRSSRKNFHKLIHLFEILGFHCRECFYAGNEAGWGAQVMENPFAKLTLFLDVDLGPDEIVSDFAHELLAERDQLGTIGLWCALHGDSILKAGMHHLEAQFDFELLRIDLEKRGVKMMNPFSNFSYLKQAFTAAEIWSVDPRKVQILLEEGKITMQQAEKFLTEGAIGSHLENLQREEGYKGFNSKNVSSIIQETDPRN